MNALSDHPRWMFKKNSIEFFIGLDFYLYYFYSGCTLSHVLPECSMIIWPCHATWVTATSSVTFILMYRQAALTNTLISSIFPLKTWGLVTSTLLFCCWRSMVLTCYCRITIMVRSCSSLVWGEQVLKSIPFVAVVVGGTLTIVMVMVMFPCRRMNSLLCLYLWLTTD